MQNLSKKKVNKHRNELAFDALFEVVRLLGWTDQFPDDYYWIIYHPAEGVKLYSCVGSFVWLKRKLSRLDYYYAEKIYTLKYSSMETILGMVEKEGWRLK